MILTFVPVFLSTFFCSLFSFLEVYDQFYYSYEVQRMESYFFASCPKSCVWPKIVENHDVCNGLWYFPSSSAIRTQHKSPSNYGGGRVPRKKVRAFSVTSIFSAPPSAHFFEVLLRWSHAKSNPPLLLPTWQKKRWHLYFPFLCNFPKFTDTELPFVVMELFWDLCVLLSC